MVKIIISDISAAADVMRSGMFGENPRREINYTRYIYNRAIRQDARENPVILQLTSPRAHALWITRLQEARESNRTRARARERERITAHTRFAGAAVGNGGLNGTCSFICAPVFFSVCVCICLCMCGCVWVYVYFQVLAMW